jgi:transglutaminase-like putative cysteine protease
MTEQKLMPHLRWLLRALALVLAPFMLQLAPWVPLMALLLGIWRYRLAYRQRPLPGMKILAPLTVLGALGILASYGGIFGRDAGVALLVLMTALKTMETHTRRDITLAVFLGYFLCVCIFLFTQSILVAAYIVVPLVMLTATLVSLSQPGGDLSGGAKLKLAGLMLMQAVPVMLVLFVLFPRVPGPLWGLPEDMARGQTGLSEDMSPGSISELTKSDAVAFRAVFKGAVPESSKLYWRGPVFWHYDGRTWRAGQPPKQAAETHIQPLTAPVEYTVTLEPHNKSWLFFLDLPTRWQSAGQLTADYQVLSRGPVRQRLRYEAASTLHYLDHSQLDAATHHRALQLPTVGNPKTRQLAAQWKAESPTPQAIIQRALQMYRDGFTYTLNPPQLGASPIDGFLFDTRRGFCEHFAGSFVFLMRAAGIPARVVTGYQGGQSNPMSDYLIVRQSDAHAWAEVWLQDEGWIRIDPTAAVAPQRVERGIAAAIPATEPLPALARPELTWIKRFNLGWDAVNNGWNQWVLGYNDQRQAAFLSKLAGAKVDWGDMARWLVIALSGVIAAIAALMLRSTHARIDPIQRQWQYFLRKLGRAGIAPYPAEGPRDFANRAALQLPQKQAEIKTIAKLYLEARYGGHDAIATLRRHVQAFRPR